jgi:hypothetical protein
MNQLSIEANDSTQNIHPQHQSCIFAPFNTYVKRWTEGGPLATWNQRLIYPAGTRRHEYGGIINGMPLGMGSTQSGTLVESNNAGFYGDSLGEVIFSQAEYGTPGSYKVWSCTVRGFVQRLAVGGADVNLIKYKLLKWTRLTDGDTTIEVLVDPVPLVDNKAAFTYENILVEMTPTVEFISLRIASVQIDFLPAGGMSLHSWGRHFHVNILPVT